MLAEYLKLADAEISEIIAHKLYSIITADENIDLNTSYVLHIFKPNKPIATRSLRPICFVPVMRKIILSIVLNRIREAAEHYIGQTQSAFRPIRSTADIT